MYHLSLSLSLEEEEEEEEAEEEAEEQVEEAEGGQDDKEGRLELYLLHMQLHCQGIPNLQDQNRTAKVSWRITIGRQGPLIWSRV
jgi:hypothetical protein